MPNSLAIFPELALVITGGISEFDTCDLTARMITSRDFSVTRHRCYGTVISSYQQVVYIAGSTVRTLSSNACAAYDAHNEQGPGRTGCWSRSTVFVSSEIVSTAHRRTSDYSDPPQTSPVKSAPRLL